MYLFTYCVCCSLESLIWRFFVLLFSDLAINSVLLLGRMWEEKDDRIWRWLSLCEWSNKFRNNYNYGNTNRVSDRIRIFDGIKMSLTNRLLFGWFWLALTRWWLFLNLELFWNYHWKYDTLGGLEMRHETLFYKIN